MNCKIIDINDDDVVEDDEEEDEDEEEEEEGEEVGAGGKRRKKKKKKKRMKRKFRGALSNKAQDFQVLSTDIIEELCLTRLRTFRY